MRARRTAAGLAGVLVFLALTAESGCGNSGDGKSQPAKNGGPGAARPPQNPPNPTVNVPGPVQGDPEACDGGGTAELKAAWVTETKVLPKIEYSVGGGQIPATNLSTQQTGKGTYTGLWVFSTPVACGQTVGFSLFGTPSSTYAECYIVYKGQVHSHQQSNRNCASSLTIPGK